MGKLSVGGVRIKEQAKRLLDRDLAVVVNDEDGNPVEVYNADYHQSSDLAVIRSLASENKRKKKESVANALKEGKDEEAKYRNGVAHQVERIYVVNAYNLLLNDLQVGLVEHDNIEGLANWLHAYLKGEIKEMTDDTLFNEYLSLVGGK